MSDIQKFTVTCLMLFLLMQLYRSAGTDGSKYVRVLKAPS